MSDNDNLTSSTVQATVLLASLSSSWAGEYRWWVLQSCGEIEHVTLLLGWSRMVERATRDLLAVDPTPQHYKDMQKWLLEDLEMWCIDADAGTAAWFLTHDLGTYQIMVVTDSSMIRVP